MDKPSHASPLRQAFDQLPLHLSVVDMEDAQALIGMLRQRVENYTFQEMALYLRQFVHDTPAPGMGFELMVDDEDGIYFLYCGGEEGIEIDDEDSFDDAQAQDQYCQEQNRRLEGFAQELNDSPWRTLPCLRDMVEALNAVGWRKEDMDEAIAQTLDEHGLEGHAFVAALNAHEIEIQTPAPTPTRTGRRVGL